MAKAVHPRHGSMQFWPHRRAKKEATVIKSYPSVTQTLPLGFAGYKVGMTHVQYVEQNKNSPKKGETVSVPVTVIECPPVVVVGVRVYGVVKHQQNAVFEAYASTLPKGFDKYFSQNSKNSEKQLSAYQPDDLVTRVHLVVATQPHLTSMERKRGHVFEMAIGGSVADQLGYAKEILGKTISVADAIKEGSYVDVHAVTKGKGFSSAVKRFGVRTRSHKSEKGKRTAGSLGGWKGSGHIMHRVPAPGKHGYYTRTTYNQQILKVSDKPEEIKMDGGFVRYGDVKSDYLLIKGSVHGASKRLIRFVPPMRPNPKARPISGIKYVHTGSHQG